MTAENDGTGDPNDPTVSLLAHLGDEIRLTREKAGISRTDLGKEAHVSYSAVAKIETGRRVPPQDFVETCDRVFHTEGRFVRLWPLAMKWAYPPWFRRYVELEQVASGISLFHPQLVPGLVQTEDYARAVLKTGRPTNLEEAVTARMERQRILGQEDAPQVWLILDTGALRRPAGNAAVMRGQLERLRELAESPPHVVQLVPESRGVYHAGASPFGLLRFHEGASVVHVDGFPSGYMLAEPGAVAEAHSAYDLLKATALPPDETAETLESIIKDEYT